ncbi:MAG TPA: carbohydrate binding family 9 domain-containing protein, partial [Pyrinomonadaceae bacterium]|nr:carbohydrate binding family 9 domain-containing protein [Pyrinomonadaceae bacterium]
MKILAIFFPFICFILSINAQTSISKSAPNDGLAKANSKEPNTNVADKKTPFIVPKFATPPVIDGKLDDEIWKSAVELKDFIQFQPGDRTPASKQTEVFFGYDERNLYIGIHAFDEPDKVRATVAQRDQIFDNEDSVLIVLDTFNDLRRAYLLGFNPLGIQGDGILT